MELKNLSSNWKKLQESLKKRDSSSLSTAPVPTSSSPRTKTTTIAVAGTKRKSGPSTFSDERNLRENKEGSTTVAGVVKNKKRRLEDRQLSSSSYSSNKERSTGKLQPWLEKKQKQENKRKGMEEKAIHDVDPIVKEGEGSTLVTAKISSLSLSRRSSMKSQGGAKSTNDEQNGGFSSTVEVGKYVAIDCEMVGVGPEPDKESALARVSIVNWNGDQVYDSFVHPKEKVTDWRTHVSGISPSDMVNARSFEEVQKDIAAILEGKVLVGHAIRNDLEALMLSHPQRDLRDTAKYPPYKKIAGGHQPRLKILAAEFLGLKIQEGSHSSLEDARATMLLFRRDKEGFEREHAKRWPPVRVVAVKESKEEGGSKKKPKKKKKSRKR